MKARWLDRWLIHNLCLTSVEHFVGVPQDENVQFLLYRLYINIYNIFLGWSVVTQGLVLFGSCWRVSDHVPNLMIQWYMAQLSSPNPPTVPSSRLTPSSGGEMNSMNRWTVEFGSLWTVNRSHVDARCQRPAQRPSRCARRSHWLARWSASFVGKTRGTGICCYFGSVNDEFFLMRHMGSHNAWDHRMGPVMGLLFWTIILISYLSFHHLEHWSLKELFLNDLSVTLTCQSGTTNATQKRSIQTSVVKPLNLKRL